MKYILTWTDSDTMYIKRYTDFFTAFAEYKQLSFNMAICQVWLDEYNEQGRLIQNWYICHN